jgi:hypothetical protein
MAGPVRALATIVGAARIAGGPLLSLSPDRPGTYCRSEGARRETVDRIRRSAEVADYLTRPSGAHFGTLRSPSGLPTTRIQKPMPDDVQAIDLLDDAEFTAGIEGHAIAESQSDIRKSSSATTTIPANRP